tara:strand:+ start:299 stop:481 length:183 start_codon:yes stop_codon:yes gene_type:complete
LAGNTAKSKAIVIRAPNFRLFLKNNSIPITTSTIPLMKTNSSINIKYGGTRGIKKLGFVK